LAAARRIGRIAPALLAAALLADGCTSTALPDPYHSLYVTNGTDVPVVVVVNGLALDTLAPGGPALVMKEPDLPFPPWAVEARNAGGRVLARLDVPSLDEVGPQRGYVERADLACGRLEMWVGPPPAGPPFSPDPARPCD
jgi:hypothetical protein